MAGFHGRRYYAKGRVVSRETKRQIALALAIDEEPVCTVADRFGVSRTLVYHIKKSIVSEPARLAEEACRDADILEEIATVLAERDAASPDTTPDTNPPAEPDSPEESQEESDPYAGLRRLVRRQAELEAEREPRLFQSDPREVPYLTQPRRD